jgi:hypothetical protein
VPFLIDVTTKRSPNHGPRTAAVSAIVLHTGEGTRASDLHELTRTDRPRRVSSHYYVDRAGAILQLVDDHREAWHAGESHYIGSTNWNAFSIGIETEHARGQNWPAVQIDAVRWLITTLAQRHRIATDYIAAHRWIAPTRKLDPTDLVDLRLNDLFAAAGTGYRLAWRPYRVTANGSRVRATPTTNGAIHQTLNAGATFWATPVAGASVGRNTTWLALRYGGYMHSSLPAVATDLEQPKPLPTVRYRVAAVPVYQRQDLTGAIAGHLRAGDVVEVDVTYPNGAGHLASGLGFVRLDRLERL